MKTIEESIRDVQRFDFLSATQKEIEEVLPTFGLNNEEPHEFPKIFEKYMGWGIKFWQYPNQFSKLITFLKDKEIDSYFEIGVRWGGTFIILNEILRSKNPNLESHCLDMIYPSDILQTYQQDFLVKNFIYHQIDSHDTFIFQTLEDGEGTVPKKQFDLVFIDGCHSYQCVKRDYLLALMLGTRFIVFHDIVNVNTQGCRLLWSEIKKNHKKTYEFVDQYDGMKGKYLGIGVVEITTEDYIFPMFRAHYNHLFAW